MRILNIAESAYRGTIEEQDDTILWLTQALRNNGADIALLLRGHAVNYAVAGQDASGLRFGHWQAKHPPTPDRDLRQMLDKGMTIYLVTEDAEERGLQEGDLTPGLERISRAQLAELIEGYDQVWHW